MRGSHSEFLWMVRDSYSTISDVSPAADVAQSPSGGTDVGSQRARAAPPGTRCPARFTEQPHAAAKGLGPRLASHRPGTGPGAAGHQPRAGVWSPCVTGRLAPAARDRDASAVYRLRADDL